MIDSFSASFAEARGKFCQASHEAGARLYSYPCEELTGKDGEALTTDLAILGDTSAQKAAIVITGTHGSEGYCGSAILHRWLVDHTVAPIVAGLKLVLVHAINPWAFSHKTRANENNVDLNRNFLSGDSGYCRKNPSYDRLAPFLHASAATAEDHLAAFDGYHACIGLYGAHLDAECIEGQSDWPEGIYYTGRGPEWSNRTFRRIVADHLGLSKTIGFIDFHTGMGRYGETVHLIFDDPDSEAFAVAEGWWHLQRAGNGIRAAGALPRYDGLLCKAIRQDLSRPKIAGAVIEFGTGDDYSVFRADRLDRWLRHEGRNDPDHERLREDYQNACCPPDVAWQRSVLTKGPRLIDDMVSGLSTWTV